MNMLRVFIHLHCSRWPKFWNQICFVLPIVNASLRHTTTFSPSDCPRSPRPSRLLPCTCLACPVDGHVIFQVQRAKRIIFQLYHDVSSTFREQCSNQCQEEPARTFAYTSILTQPDKTGELWKHDSINAINFPAPPVVVSCGPERKQTNCTCWYTKWTSQTIC